MRRSEQPVVPTRLRLGGLPGKLGTSPGQSAPGGQLSASERDIVFRPPPSVQAWLPEGYLARQLVEVAEGLDLGALERANAGKGGAAYHPALLLAPSI
jgi:hypothetical protein